VTRFPNGKRFAFSVFDDTDGSTVENVLSVYRLLSDLAIKTTKSVWPLPNVTGAKTGGATLAEPKYLDFVLWLQSEGFEIGLHNVRNHDALRQIVQLGLDRFFDRIGMHPTTHCNHDSNRENLYWGSSRFRTPFIRLGYNLTAQMNHNHSFEGDIEQSPYFWGDLCRERIQYVRNFVFDEINLDRINATLPYHDCRTPFVNYWFSSTDGATVKSFCRMLSEANQDRLEAEGGVCIMYTHFSAGFGNCGELHPEFERLMRRLAKKTTGWFVPVATLLDHLRANQKTSVIANAELARMERRWFVSKLCKGTT